MSSATTTGRTVGVLLLLQLVGLILPFVLLLPLTGPSQAYLVDAVTAASRIRVAVLLLFANGALTIGITILAFQTIRQRSEAMALWLLAASIAMFVLQAVDNVQVLTMVGLSEQYARAGGDAPARTLAALVASTRRWAHLTELVVIDSWIFLLYATLHRFALVPRVLAGFGLVTVALHFLGIPLRGFMGYGPVALMGPPMGLSHAALAVWLMWKGFTSR